MFPDIKICLYKLLTNKNSGLSKIGVLYCVISPTLFSCPHSERRAVLGSLTSLTLLGRNSRDVPAALALESKELVKSVRAILDMDCKFSDIFFFFYYLQNNSFNKTK